MTRKHSSIDQLSTATTRQAQSEMAIMQRELSKLRDSLSNASRSIKEPIIKTSRKRTKKTTDKPSIFDRALEDIGSLSAGDLLDEVGSTRSSSSVAQKAGDVLAQIAAGQRIR